MENRISMSGTRLMHTAIFKARSGMLDEVPPAGKASGPQDRNATRPPQNGGLARECPTIYLEPFPSLRSLRPGRSTRRRSLCERSTQPAGIVLCERCDIPEV